MSNKLNGIIVIFIFTELNANKLYSFNKCHFSGFRILNI